MKYLALILLSAAALFAARPEFTNFQAREKYLKYGKMKKEVNAVFSEKTIDRYVSFSIPVPDRKIFDDLFSDLGYAVAMAKKHAKKKYVIYLTNGAYKAYDGYDTYATIYPVSIDRKASRYIYFCDGIFDYTPDIKGAMILDISFTDDGASTRFQVDAFVQVKNFDSILYYARGWFDSIDKLVMQLVDNTVTDITRTGIRVGKAIYFEQTGIRAQNAKRVEYQVQGGKNPPKVGSDD